MDWQLSQKKQVKPKQNSNPSSLKGIDTHAKQSAEKLSKWDIMLVYGEGNHPKNTQEENKLDITICWRLPKAHSVGIGPIGKIRSKSR
jgi:hypothetical protein